MRNPKTGSLSNSKDPDEMQHNDAAFHPCPHCLLRQNPSSEKEIDISHILNYNQMVILRFIQWTAPEDPNEMLHNMAFHLVLHCLLRENQSSGKEIC